MWVKICANTNLEDSLLAAKLGASAVGFVFAPSKRQVTPEQVAAIVPHLPVSLEKIGVFTTRDAQEILATVRAAGLTGVQLHGEFDLDLAQRLRSELGREISMIQAVHWVVGDRSSDLGHTSGGNIDEVRAQLQAIEREPSIDLVLVDSKIGGASGGSGVSFDWGAARSVFTCSRIRLIVAGGLDADNVGTAVAALKPWGVDVASGVEAGAGRKHPERLRRFIESAFVL
jgi:phosphoribosylanthranilate isomerase